MDFGEKEAEEAEGPEKEKEEVPGVVVRTHYGPPSLNLPPPSPAGAPIKQYTVLYPLGYTEQGCAVGNDARSSVRLRFE